MFIADQQTIPKTTTVNYEKNSWKAMSQMHCNKTNSSTIQYYSFQPIQQQQFQ